MSRIIELLTDALEHHLIYQVYMAKMLINKHPDNAEREALTKLAEAIAESFVE